MPVVLTVGLVVGGCQEGSGALRTWRAGDHDQAELTAKPVQQAAEDNEPVEGAEMAGGRASSPHAMDGSKASMAMQTWARRCMGCHGQIGSGDGPQAEGLNVPDLSASSWQAKVSDEEIANAIRLGKGKMPGVALEPPVVAELVGLVRRMVVNAPPADRPVTAPPTARPVTAPTQTNQPKP